jgi:hypothetical protein
LLRASEVTKKRLDLSLIRLLFLEVAEGTGSNMFLSELSTTQVWFHSLSFGSYVVVINLLALSFSHLLDFHQFWQRNWSAVGNG